MLQRSPAPVLFACLLVLTGEAGAQPALTTKPAAPPAVRRDPKGVQGVSPFTEALGRGDRALLAHDLEGAIASYRDALAKEPQNALGHYRLGEAQLLKGDLPAAEAAFGAGLRAVAPTNLALKAKLQFGLADLHERQKAYDQAGAQWSEYELTTQSGEQGFPASGAERRRVLDAWKKLSADSLAVKARIEKGVQAADEAVRKSAK